MIQKFKLWCAIAVCFTLSTSASARDLILTMGGDVNFNVSPQPPQAHGVQRFGRNYSWDEISRDLLPLINGDLNFANIETVVTDRDLRASQQNKQFTFQSHINSIRHLAENKFNLMALANNHAYDYGIPGYLQTIESMAELKRQFPNLIYHGVGRDLEDASTPVVFEKNGIKFAFASISFSEAGLFAKFNAPGLIDINQPESLNLLLSKMSAIKADYKILSIHYGTENIVQLDGGQRRRYNDILQNGDIDLIIGHHPHVVRPIEIVNGKVIIYSLGNYMMLGARDMDPLPTPVNYGLFLRASIAKDSKNSRAYMRTLEAIPLRGMNINPRPMDPANAQSRIQYLNSLNLTQLGSQGAQFQIQNDGSGVLSLLPAR